MKVGVVGVGHIGNVVVACLVEQGHRVVCFDTNRARMLAVASGVATVKEPGVAQRLAAGRTAGRLSAAEDECGLVDADILIVCVGSAFQAAGALDQSHLLLAAQTIGKVVAKRSRELPPLLVVFRGTMLPGTMTRTILPALADASGEAPGQRYDAAYNPEFLREGTAIDDYLSPARIVIGERLPGTATRLMELYSGIAAPVFSISFEAAELVKYMDNAFHALKVAFANEIGRYAIASDIPLAEAVEVFLADAKLNLSASYLRPGAPFGGPCLAKDLRALEADMESRGVIAPVIGRVLESNARHGEFLAGEIERRSGPASRILLIGLSFKAETADLWESPFIRLAETLVDRGHRLTIFDPDLAGIDWDSDGELTRLALTTRLRGLVVTRLPEPADWNLIVLGKPGHGSAVSFPPGVPIYRIDRL